MVCLIPVSRLFHLQKKLEGIIDVHMHIGGERNALEVLKDLKIQVKEILEDERRSARKQGSASLLKQDSA